VIGEDADLEAMHRAGIRGARVNLETEGDHDIQKIKRTAQRVASLGWHVQVFAKIEILREIEIDVPLVIDHFGLADSAEPLLSLMKKRDVWVKISAPHRLSVDARPIIAALVAAHPDRLVWGSDWPHVPRARRSPERREPFEAVDDAAALALPLPERARALVAAAVAKEAAALERLVEPALDRKLKELSPVERGILLMAAFELKNAPEIPYRVVINEAIELAKSFGGTDGYKYVNGVLDKLGAQLRPDERRQRN